jgi:glutamate-1-semialdehyde 2,1-aminomutase
MIGVFLGVERVASWDDVADLDGELFARFFQASLERGVLLPPSAYEAWFLMEDHLDGALDKALDALEEAIAEAAT